jgi:hypothetical protein
VFKLATDWDTGFSEFVHRPDSKLLKTRFGNCICFRPQVREDTYSVGSLRKSYPQSLGPVGRKQIQFPKRCVFSNFESGRWTKSENPVSLCVIHHRQNPIVSTSHRLPNKLEIRGNNITPTFKNHAITQIHPCRRKDCANKSFGRVDGTHMKNRI